MGIGVNRVRREIGFVLQKQVQNMNGLIGTAGDKPREQRLILRFRPKFALSPIIFSVGDVPNFGRKLRQVLM